MFINEITAFNQDEVYKIADAWVNISGKVQKNETVLIYYDISGRQLAKEVASICTKIGARVIYEVREMELNHILVKNQDRRNIERMNQYIDPKFMAADVVFIIRAMQDTNILSDVPRESIGYMSTANDPVIMKYRVNNTRWQLIYWPTQEEAVQDGLSYDQYVELFFNACNQNWQAIENAQQKLIELLDAGKKLQFKAGILNDISRQTDISMSIEGMTFFNSTIDNNFPGSEVFSSPVKNSLNGVIFAEGVYRYSSEGVEVEDMRLTVENGKIVKVEAKRGLNEVTALFDRDEGSRYFGEIAFGTNPGLRRRLFNPLLNEKVGGSFHITPGNAYEDMRDGTGKKAHLDNGNRSQIHWDMTIMMMPQYGGGEVWLDGKLIQKDGKFLDPELSELNRWL